MNAWQELKRIFGKLTLLEIATHDLAEAELSKLKAHAVHEHAASVVAYEGTKIKRLKEQINNLTKATRSPTFIGTDQ